MLKRQLAVKDENMLDSLHKNTYVQVFQNESFRRFWIGFTLSSLGDAMARVALTWFVLDTTDSARALGLLTILYTAPILIGGLVAGSLLDRFDRRRVMLADNLVRGSVMATIPLLYAVGRLELWHVYVAAVVYGSLMMISLAGSPALLPSIVRRDQLVTVNALETLGFTVGSIVGPPVAGLLILWIGAPNVLLIDAATYFVFALALTGVRYLDAPETADESVSSNRYTLGDAFRLLLNNRILLTTTLMYMAFNVGFGASFVWLPVYAERTLQGGAGLFGLLLGAMAVGQLAGAIVAGGMNRHLTLGNLICLFGFLAGASLLLLLLKNTALAFVSLGIFGAMMAPLTIWGQTLRMEIIPERLRGRTFALLRMLMQGTIPVGGAMAGFLLPVVGIGAIIGCSSTVMMSASAAASRVGELRSAGPPPELADLTSLEISSE